MIEQTLAIIKPDAFRNGKTAEILTHASNAGLAVVALKRVHLPRATWETFYAEHENKDFFPALVDFMASGPCAVVIFEGVDAVAAWRQLIGGSDPRTAAPGTLRAIYGTGTPENALHGSDSWTAAAREILLMFA